MALQRVNYDIEPCFFPPSFLRGPHRPYNARIFGLKNMFHGMTDQQFYNLGVTHLLVTGGYSSTVPRERMFSLVKYGTVGLPHNSDIGAFEMAGRNYAGATGKTPALLLTSELKEELDNRGAADSRAKTVAFLRGYMQEVLNANPGLTISDTNSFGEYGGIGIISGMGSPSPSKAVMFRDNLTTQEKARKAFAPGEGVFKEYNLPYLDDGRYNAHNVLFKLYYLSLEDVNGSFFPTFVFNREKYAIAFPDRSQGGFGWEQIQDLDSSINAKDGWNYPMDDGTLYVGFNTLSVAPAYWAFACVVYCHLLTDKGYFNWSGFSGIRNEKPTRSNSESLFGYWDGGVWYGVGNIRKWKPNGGTWQDYNQNNPAHPSLHGGGGATKYHNTPFEAMMQGDHVMNSLFSENRIQTVEYGSFSINGGASFYTPNPGTNGVKISSLYSPNHNSANPACDPGINRQAICFVASGPGGKAFFFHDTFLLSTEKRGNVIIRHGGNDYNLGMLQGSRLHIFKD